MQPSTWNNTNQHWIPQFLLKGFGLKRNASHVYQLDKETEEISVCEVSEVASRRALLTDCDDNLMKDIENQTAPVIGKIRKGNTIINEGERKGLDRLVAAMMQNDPYNGFDRENTRQDIIKTLTQEVVDTFATSGGLVNDEVMKEIIEEQFNHDYLTLMFDREDNQISAVLGFMGLTANYFSGDGSFIIGDAPVLAVRNSLDGFSSLQNPGSQVILPVSSKCLLVYQWATPRNLVEKAPQVDKEQALSLNRDYYHGSNCRFLYGRTSDSLEQSRTLQQQGMPRTRSIEVADGWEAMQSELRNQEVRDRTKDIEDREALSREARRVVELARTELGMPADP